MLKPEQAFVLFTSCNSSDLQDVYVEELVTRSPADPSTVSAIEKAFEDRAREWVEAEAHSGAQACPDMGPVDSPDDSVGQDADVQEVNPPGGSSSGSSGAASFTRVMIGNVKPKVLSQIVGDRDGHQLCR